ncbi:VOC family protein [Streptomyces sp. NPDC058374]|uniref:VOC family protein n=1 Tax=unclassified Streptomyces TaxID=2593676 RepID=UPI003669D014
MILRIDHVGLATEDPGGVAAFMTTLGLRKYDEGHADDYGVACEFWQFGGGLGNPAVEIVSPTQEPSAISGRLARQGPGLYHLAFEVDDLESETARLRGEGWTAVDATPCKGARDGMTVAFLYAPAPAGLLVELVHYAPAPGGRG